MQTVRSLIASAPNGNRTLLQNGLLAQLLQMVTALNPVPQPLRYLVSDSLEQLSLNTADLDLMMERGVLPLLKKVVQLLLDPLFEMPLTKVLGVIEKLVLVDRFKSSVVESGLIGIMIDFCRNQSVTLTNVYKEFIMKAIYFASAKLELTPAIARQGGVGFLMDLLRARLTNVDDDSRYLFLSLFHFSTDDYLSERIVALGGVDLFRSFLSNEAEYLSPSDKLYLLYTIHNYTCSESSQAMVGGDVLVQTLTDLLKDTENPLTAVQKTTVLGSLVNLASSVDNRLFLKRSSVMEDIIVMLQLASTTAEQRFHLVRLLAFFAESFSQDIQAYITDLSSAEYAAFCAGMVKHPVGSILLRKECFNPKVSTCFSRRCGSSRVRPV